MAMASVCRIAEPQQQQQKQQQQQFLEAPAAASMAAGTPSAQAPTPAAPTPATAGPPASTSSGSRILFLVVVSGADLDCLEEPRPAGPRYTRDSLRSLLQLLGCKPRLAYKISLGVFAAVDQAVASARGTRRTTFQVHPHRNGKLWVSLTRGDFMGLVSGCAGQYAYKISPSSDELKVACRWGAVFIIRIGIVTAQQRSECRC
jgi:hypothetical protein